MSDPKRTKGRLQFLLIAAIFFGPLLFAAWLYYSGDALQPESRANHGALLEPIVNLLDAVPESRVHDDRAWRLLYAEDGECGETCRKAENGCQTGGASGGSGSEAKLAST